MISSGRAAIPCTSFGEVNAHVVVGHSLLVADRAQICRSRPRSSRTEPRTELSPRRLSRRPSICSSSTMARPSQSESCLCQVASLGCCLGAQSEPRGAEREIVVAWCRVRE